LCIFSTVHSLLLPAWLVQVEAFGKHSMLRELANLVLIMASAPPAYLPACLLPCPALDASSALAAAVRTAAS
jgi:hypothetical protein